MRDAAVLGLGVVLVMSACASHQPVAKTETTPARVVERTPEPVRAEHDDGIQIAGTIGTVKEEEVEEVLKAHLPELLDCVKTSKAKFRYLGGAVALKVRLDQRGSAKAVYLSQSSLGNREAEECLVRIVAALRFAAPRGGKEAEFDYPVDFGNAPDVGAWEAGRVEPRMIALRRSMRDCKTRAGLPTGITMTVYVGPGGKILSAGFSADAPIAAPVAACLLSHVQRVRLDDPLGRVVKAQAALALRE